MLTEGDDGRNNVLCSKGKRAGYLSAQKISIGNPEYNLSFEYRDISAEVKLLHLEFISSIYFYYYH